MSRLVDNRVGVVLRLSEVDIKISSFGNAEAWNLSLSVCSARIWLSVYEEKGSGVDLHQWLGRIVKESVSFVVSGKGFHADCTWMVDVFYKYVYAKK